MPDLKNKTLILSASMNYPKITEVFIQSLINTLKKSPDTIAIHFDNNSNDATKAILKKNPHPQLTTIFNKENRGKANPSNDYIKANINDNNLPKAIVSLDGDITFSPESFHHLINATTNIPKMGMLGMRYSKNEFNPEVWVFWTRTYKGRDNKPYKIGIPFLHNVAGGIFAITGDVLKNHLNYEFFPEAEGKTYYTDDAFLHDKLRKKGLRYGYLNGTEATHYKSAGKTLILDAP